MVSLSFIALVDDASRFRKSADVGAFLGLTPRRYQSGEGVVARIGCQVLTQAFATTTDMLNAA